MTPFAVLELTGNTTATTISAANSAVLVAGAWDISQTFGLTGASDGRVTYPGDKDRILSVSASLTVAPVVASDQVIAFYVAVNGVIEAASKRQATVSIGLPEVVGFEFKKELEQNDYVEIYVANESSDDNLLISEAKLRVS